VLEQHAVVTKMRVFSAILGRTLTKRFYVFFLFSKGQSICMEDVFSQELKGCPGQTEFSDVHHKLSCARGWFSDIGKCGG